MWSVEHGVFGAAVSQLGFHQRWGARTTALFIVASLLPDVDSVTLFFGREAYFSYHRGLTHTLGAAVLGAALLAALFCAARGHLPPTSRGEKPREEQSDHAVRQPAGWRAGGPADGGAWREFGLFFGIGLLAIMGHLLADTLYPWPIPIFWPLSSRKLAFDVLGWGDGGIRNWTIVTMLALAVLRRHRRAVALFSLAALALYIGWRFQLS